MKLPASEGDERDYEQCAINKNWHSKERCRTWPRYEANAMLAGDVVPHAPGLKAEVPPVNIPCNVNERSDRASGGYECANEMSPTEEPVKEICHNGTEDGRMLSKLKKSNFLKRELKRIRSSSFRRKKGNKLNAENTNDKYHFKGYEIGNPILQGGHYNLEKFRCTPITDGDSTLSQSSYSSVVSTPASTPSIRIRHLQQEQMVKEFRISDHSTDELTLACDESLSYLDLPEALQQDECEEEGLFLIPQTHTPGTFPDVMIKSLSRHQSECDSLPPLSPRVDLKQTDVIDGSDAVPSNDWGNSVRPVSVYDNISKSTGSYPASVHSMLGLLDPYTPFGDSIAEDESPSECYWNVDEIVERAELLKREITIWEKEDEKSLSDDCTAFRRVDSATDFNQRKSEDDLRISSRRDYTSGRRVSDSSQVYRNSPVRSLSQSDGQRFSTHGYHRPRLDHLSAGQLMILRRLSALKLRDLMEKHALKHANENSGNYNWYIPRFIRQNRLADKGKKVFGVPLLHNVQRLGQPIPNCILNAMDYLKVTSLDQVGLFRKPGVKSRIQKLSEACEADPEMRCFDDWSAYDIADMVKQYFRDLPDPVMTAKLSDTFTGIFLYVPNDLRTEALSATLIMLPDENAEALRTLIWFLRKVALYSYENQMNESNLAVCFAPSLFYQSRPNTSKQAQATTPIVRKFSRHGTASLGRPNTKDINENLASSQCLMYIIKEFQSVFKVPEDTTMQCRLSVMEQDNDVLRAELGYASTQGLGRSSTDKRREIMTDFHAYVDRMYSQAMREEARSSHSKSWGWTQIPSPQGTDLSYKKVNDGNHLRMWKCRVEIEGFTPEQVLHHLLNERRTWDDKLVWSKVILKPDDRSECVHYERSQMKPNLHRDYCLLRSWRTSESSHEVIVVVEISTHHPDAEVHNAVRAVVLTSRYLIETRSSNTWASDSTSSTLSTGSNGSGPKCYVTHVSRVDTKGRSPEWYNKAYGHVVLGLLSKMRDSLKQQYD